MVFNETMVMENPTVVRGRHGRRQRLYLEMAYDVKLHKDLVDFRDSTVKADIQVEPADANKPKISGIFYVEDFGVKELLRLGVAGVPLRGKIGIPFEFGFTVLTYDDLTTRCLYHFVVTCQ